MLSRSTSTARPHCKAIGIIAISILATSAAKPSAAQGVSAIPETNRLSWGNDVRLVSAFDCDDSGCANGDWGAASCGCGTARSGACCANGCASRGTLFQWSYGNSFSGGPDLDEPLVTDRPDFTEASSTVGRGVAQLEFGYTYVFDDDGTTSTKTHSYPEPLLRYGILADWLELRVGWNYADEEVGSIGSAGSEDLYLGFKIGLTPQEGILPEMAMIPQMTVPTGADAFSADEVLGGLNWIYGWEINDCIGTAGSTQFNRAIDDVTGQAYTEWAQSWTIGYSLTEKVGAYTEWFALFPHSADTARPEHFFNGGFSYLLNNDVQWDIRAGTGLNDAAADYFVGTGLSIRFR